MPLCILSIHDRSFEKNVRSDTSHPVLSNPATPYGPYGRDESREEIPEVRLVIVRDQFFPAFEKKRHCTLSSLPWYPKNL